VARNSVASTGKIIANSIAATPRVDAANRYRDAEDEVIFSSSIRLHPEGGNAHHLGGARWPVWDNTEPSGMPKMGHG